MSVILITLITNCLILTKIAFFLILPNVKILSPLERFKMKRDELFSKNGDSTRISWSLRELWNSVLFWNGSFTFVYSRRRVFGEKLLSFQISGALSSHFQRTAILSTVRYKFSQCALKISKQRAEILKAVESREKSNGTQGKC